MWRTGATSPRFDDPIPQQLRFLRDRTHGRTGTLWDSRYKSSVIHADTYLLTCQRYIERNPVRAAMVSDPAHYRWTSYRRNALGVADSRVTAHALFLALGSTDRSRQAAYRALFRSHLDKAAIDDIRLALKKHGIRSKDFRGWNSPGREMAA